MVNRTGIRAPTRLATQLYIVAASALVLLGWQASLSTQLIDLWLTHDQQARLMFEDKDFLGAFETFEQPHWQAVAAYRASDYISSMEILDESDDASAHYNRGNALMRLRLYEKAIDAYTLAVQAEPEWLEAGENLELATEVVEFIRKARENADDESEPQQMDADEISSDDESQGGEEVEVTRSSPLGLDSADKWMRGVETKTSEFLRTRFAIEAARESEILGEHKE